MSTAATELPCPLEAARDAVARGWRPFPLQYAGKRPAVGIKWSVATASEPTDKTLEMWFNRAPVNIGIGAKWSGLVFLDDDSLTADAMERLCEAYGQPVPKTYRVRTSKGWHWYFRNRRGTEIHNSQNGSYLKVEFGLDVRGNCGGEENVGGYVVGAGSMHESEEWVYTAEDPDAEVADLPEWLEQLLVAQSEDKDADEPTPTGVPNHERRFTEERAVAWVKRYGIEPLRTAPAPEPGKPGGRNNALNTAAVVVGHFVPAFWDQAWAVQRLTELAREVGLDREEIGPTIRSGLRKGMSEPFTKVEATDPFEEVPDPYEVELANEKRRQRLRRQAQAELDAEGREPLRVLNAEQFLDSPAPDYLVPKMFYRDGLSVVFGPPGAAKSFLVLDVALCLATGTQWRGRSIGRGRVHYVMAEGQATNTLRTKAWLAYHEVDRAELQDWFTVIPSAILLTDAGIVDYLPRVAQDKPDLIVLDTKNLMFAGKESQGDDYGAMLRVLHRIREAAGGAAVVLIDHSGLTDDTRTRGSNAQKGGVETEIRVTDENGYRRAEVTRDKSGTSGTEWLFKLVRVADVPRPADVEAPAVCAPMEAGEVAATIPFNERFEDWNDPAQPELPDDVAAYGGRGASAIKPLARFMRYSASGGVGFSMAAARDAVRKRCPDERWDRTTVDRAWGALVDMGRLVVAEGGGSTARSLWVSRPGDPS